MESINLNILGSLIGLFGIGVIGVMVAMPKLKTVMVAKEEKEELDAAMKEIYALADNDDYLVRRALRETEDNETGKSTVEDVRAWLVKHKEVSED